LRKAIAERGLQSTDTLVAIGRGKAELRELQLPPVPDDELPEMVRFQAIRSFASSGDRATVDYLVTRRSESNIEMIAAAIDPNNLTEICQTCESAELTTKRIGLRPLAAAALYLTRENHEISGDTVLIDLLSDDAEIVVARDGHVIFVRTVRMPTVEAARPKALGGELRRSLVACGSSGSLDRVVLWGLESIHLDDVKMLTEAAGTKVDVLDPFELVDVDANVRGRLPQHVGRLAPLVGLIASDDLHADRLIDFLNPRKKSEAKSNRWKHAALFGGPVAAALLIAFFGYRHLQQLDAKIQVLKDANADLQPEVDQAIERIAKTEKVDQFLDTNVNWLDELRRLAITMPASDQMIVRTVSATGDIRNGGGTMQVFGSVSDPDVIKVFEESLRDDSHRIIGDGSTYQKSEGAYDWTAREAITVAANAVRNLRYAGLAPVSQQDASADEESTASPSEPDGSTTAPSSDQPLAAAADTESAPSDSALPADVPADAGSADTGSADTGSADTGSADSLPDSSEPSSIDDDSSQPSDVDANEPPDLARQAQTEVPS
jgi:hypothetical protein